MTQLYVRPCAGSNEIPYRSRFCCVQWYDGSALATLAEGQLIPKQFIPQGATYRDNRLADSPVGEFAAAKGPATQYMSYAAAKHTGYWHPRKSGKQHLRAGTRARRWAGS